MRLLVYGVAVHRGITVLFVTGVIAATAACGTSGHEARVHPLNGPATERGYFR
jgi:hypothetical protein